MPRAWNESRDPMTDPAALTGPAEAAWRLGVLFSRTGVTAGVETSQYRATLLAIEEINAAGGVLGRPIEPIAYDPASTPKQFQQLGERLLAVDHVRLIVGCYMSSTRKALLPTVEAHRGLLFYPTLYEGFEYSAHCIYTGATPNQNSRPLADYLLGEYGKRMFFVGSNYVYPYESNRIMSELVFHGGGEVLDEIYVPLDAQPADFARAIRQIDRARPDVIFSTVVGRSTAVFYEAYRQAGFDPSAMPIASLTTGEAEIAEMTPAAAAGHVTAAPFFSVLDTPAARRFTAAFAKRWGAEAPVSAGSEAAYFQIMLIARAIERAGSDAPDAIRAALFDIEYDAPQGRVRVDADNNHTFLWPRVARLDAGGRFEIVWDPAVRVKPAPYLIEQSLPNWADAVPAKARHAAGV